MTNSLSGYAINLVETVCALAGSPDYLRDLTTHARREGLIKAVVDHNSPTLFDWFVQAASFQGVSDRAARTYMAENGQARWHAIEASLKGQPSCNKLRSYWQFERCHYRKAEAHCACPVLIGRCPVPHLPLRNGNLNQLAYSLFLFIRDVAGGDLVDWLDHRITDTPVADGADPFGPKREAVLDPLRDVFGVSDKVLNMTLANLLVGAAGNRRSWVEVGASMIAIDRLVHNFFVRTGILSKHAAHPYGERCYQPGGCAELLRAVSLEIDSRRFNASFPSTFPRFIQSAIWRYCAQDELGICNGVTVDDRSRCRNDDCRLFAGCRRRPLRPAA